MCSVSVGSRDLGRRTRGKSKQPNWRRDPDDGLAVVVLELDVADAGSQGRLARHFRVAFELRRALQRDARRRCRIYWCSRRERRRRSPSDVRARLGLSQAGFEGLAKRYLERAPKLAAHVTKAMGLHIADSVWQAARRNLFVDGSGRRAGLPRVGRFYDFTRIPGRARSHTRANKWETHRLHGTLQGHLDTYRANNCHAGTVDDVVGLGPGVRVLDQPAKMGAPKLTVSSWHEHQGALCMVVNLPGGELVVPVRLPSGSGRWPRLVHFLTDPGCWHKVDLVRVPDRRAHGGWRYEAHLTVLAPGYQSPAERERRGRVALDRRAGADANVSNVTVSSIAADGSRLATSRVDVSEHEKHSALERQRKRARSQRRLDRSRRATNPQQYEISARQARHNERRVARGLGPVEFGVHNGYRVANKAGVPKRPYRKDTLSRGFLKTRVQLSEQASAVSRAKHDRARRLAAQLVERHGAHLVVEEVSVANWTRLWGKQIALFSPGMLIAALHHEARACGGQMLKADTRQTRMSQMCLCGVQVRKTLRDRVHVCDGCGLVCDRDQVSSILAACTRLADPEDPSTARVDPALAMAARKQLFTTSSNGPARGPGTVNSTTSGDTPDSAQTPDRVVPCRDDRDPGTGTGADTSFDATSPQDTVISNLLADAGPPGENCDSTLSQP